METLFGKKFRLVSAALTLFALGACTKPGTGNTPIVTIPPPSGTADGIGGGDPFTTYLYQVRDNILVPAVDSLLAGGYTGNPCDYDVCSGEGTRPVACRRKPVLNSNQVGSCYSLLLRNLLAIKAKLTDAAVTLKGTNESFQSASDSPLMRTNLGPSGEIRASRADIEALALDSHEVAAVLLHEYLHKIPDVATGSIPTDETAIGSFDGPRGGSAALTSVGYAIALHALRASAPAAPQGTPVLRFDGLTSFSFGFKPPGTTTVKEVTLSNIGDGEALDIRFAMISAPFEISGSCLSLNRLAAGANCRLTVQYRPLAEGDGFEAISASYQQGTRRQTAMLPVYGRSRTPYAFIASNTGAVETMNLTTGARSPRVTGSKAASVPVTAATGDLDGDGQNELVLAVNGELAFYDAATGAPKTSAIPAVPFAGSPWLSVAIADFNLDGRSELVVGSGRDVIATVKVFDGVTGQVLRTISPYSTFGGGVYVAAGDANGDGIADILTGAGPNGGPHVKLYDGATGNLLQALFPYNPGFGGGVTVALGDTDGDGISEIITGAGTTGGAHIRVIDSRNLAVKGEYFAWSSEAPEGVRVSAGDVNGDGKDDIVAVPFQNTNFPLRVFSSHTPTVLFERAVAPAGATYLAASFGRL